MVGIKFEQMLTTKPVNTKYITSTGANNANELLFLEAKCLGSQHFPQLSAATAVIYAETFIQYQKSPGITTLEFIFEIYSPRGASGLKTYAIDLSLPVSASFVGGTENKFNSAVSQSLRQIVPFPTYSVNRQQVRGLIDVSNCSSGSVLTFTASWTAITGSVSAANALGFRTLTVNEIPNLNILSYGAMHPGAQNFSFGVEGPYGAPGGWGAPGTDLCDSVTGRKRGIQQIVQALDINRQQYRNQFNISSLNDAGLNWIYKADYDGSENPIILTYGTGVNGSSGYNRYFFMRAKNTYGLSTTTAPYKISLIYSVTGGSSPAFHLYYRKYTGGAWSNKKINLTPSSTNQTATATIDLPTDGTDQMVEFYMAALADKVGSTVYIHNFWIGENIT